VTFQIDGHEYTIPAVSEISVPLSHGKHTMTMSGVTMGEFDFGWFDADSVINPTNSELVTVEVLYGDAQYTNKLSNNTITIDGLSYTGPYTLIPKALYIKKSWDYGAYEESPSSVSISKWSDYTIKKELYTAQGMINNFCYDGDPAEACKSE
jgi:hypothetical protein